jgi:Flp pilus assembly pilin Flp
MFDRFNVLVGSLIARTHDLKRDEGQTFVEYALIISLVAVAAAALATWSGLVTDIGAAMDKVGDKLNP